MHEEIRLLALNAYMTKYKYMIPHNPPYNTLAYKWIHVEKFPLLSLFTYLKFHYKGFFYENCQF